jgi:hypothetical protein
VTQGRKFSPHRPAVDRIAEQLLDKFPHMIAPGIEQRALVLFEKAGELSDVGLIGRDGKRRQALFDFQIVEEPFDSSIIGGGRHAISMRVIGR